MAKSSFDTPHNLQDLKAQPPRRPLIEPPGVQHPHHDRRAVAAHLDAPVPAHLLAVHALHVHREVGPDDAAPQRGHPLPVVDGRVGVVDGDAQRVGVGRREGEALGQERDGDGFRGGRGGVRAATTEAGRAGGRRGGRGGDVLCNLGGLLVPFRDDGEVFDEGIPGCGFQGED